MEITIPLKVWFIKTKEVEAEFCGFDDLVKTALDLTAPAGDLEACQEPSGHC